MSLDVIERNLESYKKAMTESNRILYLTVSNKFENFENEYKETYERHVSKISSEVSSINKNNTELLNNINNIIRNVEDRVLKINQETKSMNDVSRRNVLDIVNTRLNNFREDMVEMFHVKRVTNSDPETLKRLTRLEGIKEVIDHRVSAKEVLKRLERYEAQLLENERIGKATNEIKINIEALKWVIGEKNE